MNFYQSKYSCKDCGEPSWYDDDVRSQKTGGRIPLNSDHTKHFTTCTARNQSAYAGGQQQQQQQQQPQPIPISGPKADDWETRLGLLNSQIFSRLDRIDESVKQIARAMEGLNAYFQKQAKEELNELEYDKDKEDGLV
jgi:hypothetical protein